MRKSMRKSMRKGLKRRSHMRKKKTILNRTKLIGGSPGIRDSPRDWWIEDKLTDGRTIFYNPSKIITEVGQESYRDYRYMYIAGRNEGPYGDRSTKALAKSLALGAGDQEQVTNAGRKNKELAKKLSKIREKNRNGKEPFEYELSRTAHNKRTKWETAAAHHAAELVRASHVEHQKEVATLLREAMNKFETVEQGGVTYYIIDNVGGAVRITNALKNALQLVPRSRAYDKAAVIHNSLKKFLDERMELQVMLGNNGEIIIQRVNPPDQRPIKMGEDVVVWSRTKAERDPALGRGMRLKGETISLKLNRDGDPGERLLLLGLQRGMAYGCNERGWSQGTWDNIGTLPYLRVEYKNAWNGSKDIYMNKQHLSVSTMYWNMLYLKIGNLDKSKHIGMDVLVVRDPIRKPDNMELGIITRIEHEKARVNINGDYIYLDANRIYKKYNYDYTSNKIFSIPNGEWRESKNDSPEPEPEPEQEPEPEPEQEPEPEPEPTHSITLDYRPLRGRHAAMPQYQVDMYFNSNKELDMCRALLQWSTYGMDFFTPTPSDAYFALESAAAAAAAAADAAGISTPNFASAPPTPTGIWLATGLPREALATPPPKFGAEGERETVQLQVSAIGTVIGYGADDGEPGVYGGDEDDYRIDGHFDAATGMLDLEQIYSTGHTTRWVARYDADADKLVEGKWTLDSGLVLQFEATRVAKTGISTSLSRLAEESPEVYKRRLSSVHVSTDLVIFARLLKKIANGEATPQDNIDMERLSAQLFPDAHAGSGAEPAPAPELSPAPEPSPAPDPAPDPDPAPVPPALSTSLSRLVDESIEAYEERLSVMAKTSA